MTPRNIACTTPRWGGCRDANATHQRDDFHCRLRAIADRERCVEAGWGRAGWIGDERASHICGRPARAPLAPRPAARRARAKTCARTARRLRAPRRTMAPAT